MKPAIRGFLLLSLRTAAILVIAALALPGPVSAQTSVSGVVSASTTWTAAGSPYIVTGDVYVQGVGAPVLTIQPGVTVKFNANATLYIGYNPSGGLQAVGTAAQPILFTANTATPTPGYWRGIWLWTYAAATSQIAYATVSYGGVSNNNGGININGSSPTVSNVTVQNNIHSGITVTGGAAAISNVTSTGNQWGMVMLGTTTASVSGSSLTANTVGGVYLAAPASPSLSAMSITNNTGWAMTQDGAVTLGTVTGLTATGNTNNAIEIRASSPGANTTWKNVGLPFAVTGDVYVQGAATPVLTIQPGVTVKFNANAT
ncbi:MAG: right-handed parallel beta-helix repeat-containing protein, partial [Acidobacteriota bacterium]